MEKLKSCFRTLFGNKKHQEEIVGRGRLPMTRRYPQNIGIVAAEIYIPNCCVSQSALERHDGVPEGKYTIGLGQDAMSFIYENEDINSICLTVVSQLMERMQIDKMDIGRVEVGTETIQDKSKSVKSFLMQLFQGNTNISGVDNLNACYGGTAALFNTVAWMESADWDGRLGIVVMGDIAVYEKGPARPTGGAAAVALLIGPDAPVILERGTAAHYFDHSFDFYKPNPTSEYPLVDGQTSITWYLKALDSCYNLHLDKLGVDDISLDYFDYFVFHSPYGKLVQKSLGRLMFIDALRNPSLYPELQEYRDIIMESTFFNRDFDKLLAKISNEAFKVKTLPTKLIPSQVGNSYCASLYSGLISLFSQISAEDVGKRIGMFSYGSGLAATMFSLKVVKEPTNITLPFSEITNNLNNRHCVTPEEYESVLTAREGNYSRYDWTPTAPEYSIRPGTYFLTRIDECYRRHYDRY